MTVPTPAPHFLLMVIARLPVPLGQILDEPNNENNRDESSDDDAGDLASVQTTAPTSNNHCLGVGGGGSDVDCLSLLQDLNRGVREVSRDGTPDGDCRDLADVDLADLVLCRGCDWWRHGW